MNMTEMRTAKLSSVKRVMYRTRKLRSNATITSRIIVTQSPIQKRNDRKSIPLSLYSNSVTDSTFSISVGLHYLSRCSSISHGTKITITLSVCGRSYDRNFHSILMKFFKLVCIYSETGPETSSAFAMNVYSCKAT